MYQLCRRGDKWYIRKAPETIFKPTEYQIKQRIVFGEISKLVKEMYGKLHPAERAKVIGELMRGRRFGRTPKLKKWQILAMQELGLTEEQVNEIENLLLSLKI